MATGRSEMLRKNQERARKNRQKKAKKPETLAQKAAKAKVNTKVAFGSKQMMSGTGLVSGKGPVKSGKTYGELLKKNKKEDARGPLVRAPQHDGHKVKAPPPVPTKPKSRANTGTGRDGKLGTGTYGSLMPSNPKLKTKPGGSGTTGRPLPSNPKLKSQSTGARDPESGVRMGRTNKPGSSRPKTKLINGKLHELKNGKYVKVKM